MKEDLKKLHRSAFDYFMECAHHGEIGYGLIYDQSDDIEVASIAGSGFFLSALVIGVECNYLSKETAITMCIKALQTLIRLPHYNGFIAHFISIKDESRQKKCEYSTIDTCLCLNGAIVCQTYFNNQTITDLVNTLLTRINWDKFICVYNGKKYISMSYNPDKDGDYVNGTPGFIHRWSMTAEQLMMYIMLSNTLGEDLSKELYYNFDRPIGEYDNIKYVISPGNSLFVYQYPLVYLGDKTLVDSCGFSWFDNAKKACYANYQFCQNNINEFKFIKNTFGLSASHGPQGYRVYNSLPNMQGVANCDGTISYHAIMGSLPFIPDIAENALNILLKNESIPKGKYGFFDSFNNKQNWNSTRYYCIDKGLELLGLDYHLYNTVSKYYCSNEYIKNGLRILGFKHANN